MARIAGVNIPTQKRVIIALQYIHGIGPKFANDICTALNIPAAKRVNQLLDAEILRIREFIDAHYRVEGDLRREVSMNITGVTDAASSTGAAAEQVLAASTDLAQNATKQITEDLN